MIELANTAGGMSSGLEFRAPVSFHYTSQRCIDVFHEDFTLPLHSLCWEMLVTASLLINWSYSNPAFDYNQLNRKNIF